MSCSYAAPGSRKKHSTTSSSSGGPDDMQNRIDRLEGLVLSLMTNGSQSTGPAAQRALSMQSSPGSMEYSQDVDIDENGGPVGEESETDQVAQSLGVMRVDNNKSMYFGDAHWAAILSDVRSMSHVAFQRVANGLRFLKLRTTFRSTKSNTKRSWRRSSKPKGSMTPLLRDRLSSSEARDLHHTRSFLPNCPSVLSVIG